MAVELLKIYYITYGRTIRTLELLNLYEWSPSERQLQSFNLFGSSS
jgi:hypothetical protein